MIIFKPETDKEILSKHNCTDIYYAYENDVKTGTAYFNTDTLYCDVFKVIYPEDKLYICIGLLRSCYNKGANDGAYMGKLSDLKCKDAALSMNFIFNGECYINDIPTLLMGTCSGCCDEVLLV